jgi:hypothetical protein
VGWLILAGVVGMAAAGVAVLALSVSGGTPTPNDISDGSVIDAANVAMAGYLVTCVLALVF